jgi:hypothetical protein
MPNLVEQAELVKRLTNDQLAVAMQNPTGAIPPFIFAAEAARRQAIQEQFSGGPKESVVDTLTKQMAKVPQNIQGGGTTTPPVPPTPQMQGVMALQQQQAMQQAAQQVMPQQGMRAGGPVQRYQEGSLVQSMARRFGTRAPTVQELAQMRPDELAALRQYQSAESMKRLNERARITGGRYGQGEMHQRQLLEAQTEGPFTQFMSPETVTEAAKKLQEMPTVEEMKQTLDTGVAPRRDVPGGRELSTAEAARDFEAQMRRLAPRDKTAGQENTSTENQTAAEAAALRDRLEKLYGQTGLSDWEKAQKWFAASQQFLEPDQTLMQSVVGAAAAFAGGAAEERAAEREALIAKEKALLEWDMSRYDTQQRAAAEAARDAEQYRRELEKEGRFSIKDQASILADQITSIRSQIAKLDPMADEGQIARLQADLGNLEARLSYIYETRGGMDYSGLRTFTGDGLAKT